jgi:CBS domain-containing protein
VQGGEVVGVLSERNIFRYNGEVGARVAAREPVSRAMASPAITIEAAEPLVSAISLMLRRKLGCLPVLDHGRLVGILSTADLLEHQLDTAIDRPAAHLPSQVHAVMQLVPAVVTPETELFDAIALMRSRQVRHLPVVDQENRVVGMLSDRDVRNVVGDPRRFLDLPEGRDKVRESRVSDVMTRDVITVHRDAPVTAAIEHLLHERIGAIPVVDDRGHLVGVVSYLDVVRVVP